MSDYAPTREDLVKVAADIDGGVLTLLDEAERAAEILPTRAGGDRIEPADWARQKRRSAAAATRYAETLRREAHSMAIAAADDRARPASWTRPTPARFAQAQWVAKAAELGGILIDGRPLAAFKGESDSVFDQHERELWEAGTHPAQVKAAEIEAAGVFEHVAGPIDGVEQVPFWRLVCRCPCGHDGGCLTCGCTCEATDPHGAICPCCGADDNGDPD